MSIHALKDYYLSLEEKEETEEFEEVEEGEDVEFDDEEELEVAEEQYDYYATVHEELFATFEGLEEVVDSIELTLEHGGLDPVAAQFAHLAVNSYTSRMGIPSNDIMPALESFGGDSGRHSATTVSVEEAKGRLSKIWEAIKKAWETVWNSVKTFFARWFTALGRVDAYAKKVDANIKATKGKSLKKDSTVAIPGILKFDGGFEIGKVEKGMVNLQDSIKVLDSTYIPACKDVYKKVANDILNTDPKEEIASSESKTGWFSRGGKTFKAMNYTLPGGKSLVGAEGDIPVFKGTGGKDQSEKGANKISSSEVNMERFHRAATTLINSAKAIKNSADDFQKESEVQKNKVDGFFKKVKEEVNYKKAQFKARAFQRNVMSPVVKVASHTYKVSKGLLVVVNKVASQYGDA